MSRHELCAHNRRGDRAGCGLCLSASMSGLWRGDRRARRTMPRLLGQPDPIGRLDVRRWLTRFGHRCHRLRRRIAPAYPRVQAWQTDRARSAAGQDDCTGFAGRSGSGARPGAASSHAIVAARVQPVGVAGARTRAAGEGPADCRWTGTNTTHAQPWRSWRRGQAHGSPRRNLCEPNKSRSVARPFRSSCGRRLHNRSDGQRRRIRLANGWGRRNYARLLCQSAGLKRKRPRHKVSGAT